VTTGTATKRWTSLSVTNTASTPLTMSLAIRTDTGAWKNYTRPVYVGGLPRERIATTQDFPLTPYPAANLRCGTPCAQIPYQPYYPNVASAITYGYTGNKGLNMRTAHTTILTFQPALFSTRFLGPFLLSPRPRHSLPLRFLYPLSITQASARTAGPSSSTPTWSRRRSATCP
jgi:hypothetical protein